MKRKYSFPIFFDSDEAGGGGESPTSEALATSMFSDMPDPHVGEPATTGEPASGVAPPTPVVKPVVAAAGSGEVAPGAVQTAPVQAAPVTLSPEQLTQILKSAREPAAPPAAAAATPANPDAGLAPAEIDKKYNVVRVSEDQIGKIFAGGPDGVAALQDLMHKTALMGATLASHHLLKEMETLRSNFNDRIAPASALAERQAIDQHTTQFFAQYPQFTDQHKPILKAVYDSLAKQGFKGDAATVYKRIADGATVLIQSVNPEFGASVVAAAGAAGQPPVKAPVAARPQPVVRKMATVAPGGATGGSGGAAKAVSDGASGESLARSMFGG